MSNTLLYYNSERLKYVIKYLKLKSSDISKKLGISPSMLSQIQHESTTKLKPYHLYAISKAYDIPMEIFENREINTPQLIENILNNSSKNDSFFYQNKRLLEKLIGTWYLYAYTSYSSDIHSTQHTIYADGTIIDEHENKGRIYFGKNQSIIMKESNNSQNLTSITFDNNRVTYSFFIFSRVSKSISLNKELFNFGFFSKEPLSKDEILKVLGDKNQLQLQIDYTLIERLNQHIKI